METTRHVPGLLEHTFFEIYLTLLLYPGQRLSDRKYKQYFLYAYVKIERRPLTAVVEATMDNKPFASISLHWAEGKGPRKRVVRRQGDLAALMVGGTWEGDWIRH